MNSITAKDIGILRDLAKRQMEYAMTPENQRRNDAWYKHNDLQGEKPLVTIEEQTFMQELSRPLSCESKKGQHFEGQILLNIICREDIDDDRATPDYFAVSDNCWFLPFGCEIDVNRMSDSIGFSFVHPVSDLVQDWDKIGKSKWGFENSDDFDVAHEVFSGIMPIRRISDYPVVSLTQHLVKLMGMEALYLSMYDHPDLLIKLMSRLTDDFISFYTEMEHTGRLITNNKNQAVAQGTYGQTNALSYRENASLKDMWGYADSQETVSISPDQFDEFFFPYYKKIMDLCGLVNYGCCEPVHRIWDRCLSKCGNLRKLSISPWCDEEFIGDKLRDTNVIYHRKPSPNLVSAFGSFDEVSYAREITTTLKAAKGCKLEFSLRDIYSLNGEKDRAKKVVRLIHSLIDRYW